MDETPATFDPGRFGFIASREAGHFWFEERRRLVLWCLARHFPGAASFCDVGCGAGFILAGLEASRPDLALTGLDYYPEALPHASRRLRRTHLATADICRLTYRGEFDVVSCLDVLEHLPDDRLALANLAASIRPGGGLIVTVPQHAWLWSIADEVCHHRRRYGRADLRAKIEACGLRCERITSFMTFLLPVMALSRRTARSESDVAAERHPSPAANASGRLLFRIERLLIACGLSLPWGGSLLVVARKPAAAG